MFDLSWTEILIIGAAAIIFIGPKELPSALRTAGRLVGKARSMAREFQSNVEEMVRESELDELKKQVQKIESGDYARELEKTIDPKGEVAAALTPPDLSAPVPTETPPTAVAPPSASPETPPAPPESPTPARPA